METIVGLLDQAYYSYIARYNCEPKRLYLGSRQKEEIEKERLLLTKQMEVKTYRGIPIEWVDSKYCLKFE